MSSRKGLIRSLNRKGTRTTKKPRVAAKATASSEPACCERCGALFVRQTWRQDRRITHELLEQVRWTVCPSCQQAGRGEYYGRVLVRGGFVGANEEAIRRRIENVAARAGFTQPQRRLVSVDNVAEGLEVLTTSQKLAHRIARELCKTFRGQATYAWSDRDGSLMATWAREDNEGGPGGAHRRRSSSRAGARRR
jgi:NMD protein affecting ribosome stability and mRNA decay